MKLPSPAEDLRHVDSEEEVRACFALMRQLRPHLVDADELIARWRRQASAGYRILAIWQNDVPVALAGYRLQEMLVHGPFIYVDDLVTESSQRSTGHGRRLIAALKDEARKLDCVRLVLDTALDNVLGHRFYYRQGLLARALRFSTDLA